ncbi:CHAP domain-containing protein [Bifidobacterium biavatii]|nr:CHAP domain-containing protein [Bifidobacterium biavatii]
MSVDPVAQNAPAVASTIASHGVTPAKPSPSPVSGTGAHAARTAAVPSPVSPRSGAMPLQSGVWTNPNGYVFRTASKPSEHLVGASPSKPSSAMTGSKPVKASDAIIGHEPKKTSTGRVLHAAAPDDDDTDLLPSTVLHGRTNRVRPRGSLPIGQDEPLDAVERLAKPIVKTGKPVAQSNAHAAVSRIGAKPIREAAASKALRTAGSGEAVAGKIISTKGKGRLKRLGLRAGKGLFSIGRFGVDRLDDVRGRIVDSDTDEVGMIGAKAQDVAVFAVRKTPAASRALYHGGKNAVKGGKTVVKTGVNTVKTVSRGLSTMARFTSRAGRAIAAMAGRLYAAAVASLGAPAVLVISIVLAVVLVIGSLLSIFGQSSADSLSNVPSAYTSDVQRAGSLCDDVTGPLIAAQIEAESNWDPNAESSAGAKGIAQFMPSTWEGVGRDGDGDGHADIMNPHDAIYTQGVYMCALATQIRSYVNAGRLSGSVVDLTLAAYNAGIGNVLSHGGVPPFAETEAYVAKIKSLMAKYSGSAGGAGPGTVGDLTPKLAVNDSGVVNITGIDTSAGSTYAYGQCTWWAAIRRAQIGRPVDGFLGNGGEWGANARAKGYSVSGSPSPGDAISFHPGVLGADGTYGHVGVVESVNEDGSILISEANVRGLGVVTMRTITKAQLTAAGAGVEFVH